MNRYNCYGGDECKDGRSVDYEEVEALLRTIQSLCKPYMLTDLEIKMNTHVQVMARTLREIHDLIEKEL